jgi:hypothetical protein
MFIRQLNYPQIEVVHSLVFIWISHFPHHANFLFLLTIR